MNCASSAQIMRVTTARVFLRVQKHHHSFVPFAGPPRPALNTIRHRKESYSDPAGSCGHLHFYPGSVGKAHEGCPRMMIACISLDTDHLGTGWHCRPSSTRSNLSEREEARNAWAARRGQSKDGRFTEFQWDRQTPVFFWIGSSARRAFGGCLGDKRR